MKTAIVRIGNSRGIRIPKPLLEQYRLRDEVEMEIREDGLLIRGVAEPRSGWDDAFRRMREHDDDQGQILPHPRSCSVPTKRRTDRPGPDPHH